MEKVFFGIDIGGKSHSVHFIDEKKRPLCKDLVIDDDIVGYYQVIEAIRRLKEKHPGASFHGGAEATGIYWRNLFFFFQNELPDVTLSLINPLQTKRFKDLELDRVKTDATDARSIARYTATFEPEAAPSVPEHLADLQELCRYRKAKLKEQSKYTNLLHNYLKQAFPELCGRVKRKAGLRILALLSSFPTARDVREASASEIASIRYGKRNFKVGAETASEMKGLAESSVASRTGPGMGFAVRSVAANILRIRGELAALEEKIAELYSSCPATHLVTIPGIGPLSAAVIESEIKNISRFTTAKKLNGYIGAYPELRESGEFRLLKPRMTKCGNRYLNHAVYMCVLAAISPKAPDSTIKHMYWRQVAQGKERMVAIGSCMRKMNHIIFGILMSGKPFEASYEFPEDSFEIRFVDRETGCVVPEELAASCETAVAVRWKRAAAPKPKRRKKEVARPS